ncbi:MAG: ATP-binding protein [Chlamydiae bacterium]|nr:ATP-binding protein [Chlamydiota bacterium]
MNKEIIRQILIEQREERRAFSKNKMIQRESVFLHRKFMTSHLIKVVTGVRRCGKSTLCQDLLKNIQHGYINFDDERLIGVKAQDLNNFLEVLHEIHGEIRFLFLDEIQNVEGWELFVNRLHRAGYNILVTGSNSKLLSRELATHLTGRHFTLELFPFSFKEFLLYHDVSLPKSLVATTRERAILKKRLEEYLKYGGFPEVFQLEAKQRYLQELYDRLVTRDIVLRYRIKHVLDLKEIALFTLSHFSSRLSFHKIRNIFEMKSVHTVKNYLDYLEEAYLLFQLKAFSFKLKEQLRAPRKIYCIDTGLLNAVVPRTAPHQGRILENAVFLELKRREKELYFYSQEGFEVDFLIREGLKTKELIQVCYSLSSEETVHREIRALLKASKDLSCRTLKIITWDEEGKEKKEGRIIEIIPFWKWLCG